MSHLLEFFCHSICLFYGRADLKAEEISECKGPGRPLGRLGCHLSPITVVCRFEEIVTELANQQHPPQLAARPVSTF